MLFFDFSQYKDQYYTVLCSSWFAFCQSYCSIIMPIRHIVGFCSQPYTFPLFFGFSHSFSPVYPQDPKLSRAKFLFFGIFATYFSVDRESIQAYYSLTFLKNEPKGDSQRGRTSYHFVLLTGITKSLMIGDLSGYHPSVFLFVDKVLTTEQ